VIFWPAQKAKAKTIKRSNVRNFGKKQNLPKGKNGKSRLQWAQ